MTAKLLSLIEILDLQRIPHKLLKYTIEKDIDF